LKEVGTVHWFSGGTNDYGFTALPIGGRLETTGAFSSGLGSSWWTFTSKNATQGYTKALLNFNANTMGLYIDKRQGLPVRCVK